MIPTVMLQSVLFGIHRFFSGLLHARDLHEETMVFEAHCTSFPYTIILLFNYAKVNTKSKLLQELEMHQNEKFLAKQK